MLEPFCVDTHDICSSSITVTFHKFQNIEHFNNYQTFHATVSLSLPHQHASNLSVKHFTNAPVSDITRFLAEFSQLPNKWQ
eukprot:3370516-Amphidinium_carterae.2